MSIDDVAFLSIGGLSRAFEQGELSPVDVARVVAARTAFCEPHTNAFVARLADEDLLTLAREAETRWARGEPLGPLDGVPITVKDTLPVEGFVTRSGSRTTEGARPETQDAPAVARLREAGAIVVGKTTTPEFGWKTVTDSPLTGATRNPWNPALTPGGSSGGSAAALAAGIGAAAIGTDAAGSVRIPCAFTGLVGYKATLGRIPRFPPSALGSLGHVGPMARTVEDAALLAGLMSQDDVRDWLALGAGAYDYRAWFGRDLRRLRIAFSPNLGHATVEREVASVVDRAVRSLADSKVTLELADPPLDNSREIYRTLFAAGQSHALAKLPPARRKLLDPGLIEMLDRLGTPTLTAFLAAEEQRAALGRRARAFHQRYDLLITPTVAVAPFPVGRLAPESRDESDWMSWTPFTYPFNLTGQPAVTIPCGFTERGLPVGLQLVGALGADAAVLGAAKAFEPLLRDAHGRRPTIGRTLTSETQGLENI